MPIFAANLKYLFRELYFLERFESAAIAGFRGVEYQYPYSHPPNAVSDQLREYDLVMVSMNVPAGNRQAGERGLACLPDRVEDFRENVDQAVDYARAIGCRQINCPVGIAPHGTSPSRVRATLVENFGYAAERLAAADLTLLVEPINTRDVPGYALSRSADAREIILEVGASNLLLLYDIYHMQIMEGDIARSLEANSDILGHVQIADNPGRHEPGTGELSFNFLFDRLDEMGYEGWVSCEYEPLTETLESLEWARPYLFPHGSYDN